MPQKSFQHRAKIAKKGGTTPAVKATDVGVRGIGKKSRHALKKSSALVGYAEVEDRSVSKRSPPPKYAGKRAPDVVSEDRRRMREVDEGSRRLPKKIAAYAKAPRSATARRKGTKRLTGKG